VRTVFNMLGPLTNPAGANAQVIGVYSAALTEPLARVLAELGTVRAFVVHGADNLDEISNTGESRVSEVREGMARTFTVRPEDFGMERASINDLRGGDREENARIIRAILDGEPGPRRDIVLMNAAAGLLAAVAAIVVFVTHRHTEMVTPIKAPASETATADGWIRSADARTGTFVLVGPEDDAPQMRFRVGRAVGEPETTIFLDGTPSDFQKAIQPDRLARVAYVKVGNDLLAHEVDVTSLPDQQ
jgi:hypothetical protein